MRNLNYKIVGLALLFTTLFACNDNFEPRYERLTIVSELIIANGGMDGKSAIKGEYVPEENMFVFNDVPAETDLQNIKFSGQISLGAAPEFEKYDFFATNPQEIKIINREKFGTYKVKLNILPPAMDPAINRVVVTLEDGVTEVIGEVDKEAKIVYLDAKNGEFVYLKSIEMLPKHALYEFTAIQGSKIFQENPGTIKLNHMGRMDEYAIEFIYIPPTGADFDKIKIFDFTKDNKWPSYPGGSVRGGTLDANMVVFPKMNQFEYIPLADLLANNISTKKLSAAFTSTDIMHAFVFNGHYYTINLPSSNLGTLQVRYSTDPTYQSFTSHPFPATDGNTGGRYGDNLGMQLDENGNGYMFLIHGSGSFKTIWRLEVTNYSTISNSTFIPLANSLTPYGNQVNHVFFEPVRDHTNPIGIGSLNEYTVIHSSRFVLFDRNGVEKFEMGIKLLPVNSINSSIFYFNNSRYLGVISGDKGIEAFVTIYDITNGNSTIEALEIFKNNPPSPVFTYSLGLYSATASSNAYAGKCHTAVDATGETLYIMAKGGDTGTVIFELPKKVDE